MKFLSPIDVDGYISLITQNSGVTPTKFLIQDANGRIAFRTGQELKVDIGADYTSVLKHQVKAGVAINKGQAVYVTSADGTNMIVGLASNASEATSSKTMGLLDGTVAINGFANVVTEGLLAGLNTIGANAGDPVWLGTNGNLIYGLANKPYAPNHLVFIGIVTRVNANNGEIFVKAQNGFELDEIHDVDLKTTTKVNGHLLGYNGSLWVNKTIAGWLGYTPYNASNPAGYISSYTETDTLASVTARGASTSTQITLSGGGDNSTTYSSLRFAGYNQGGGTGYHGFFEIENTYGSATNSKKFFRLDSAGTIQIINSAYTNNIFNLTDAGDLTVGKIIKSGGTSSQYLMADGSVSTGVSVGVTSFNTRTGAVTLTSGDVTTALGYTPADDAAVVHKAGTETITGEKTFSAIRTNISGGSLTLKSGAANRVIISSYNANEIEFGVTPAGTTYNSKFIFQSSARDYTFPNATGTVALTSDLAGYVPTSRTITINGTSYDLSANRSWTVTASETDTLATVVARGDTTGGGRPIRLDTSGGGVSIRGSVGGWATGYYFMGSSNTYRGGFGALGDADGLSNYWIGPAYNNYYSLIDSSQLYHTNSVRSPIFYDSNNTGYYVDPASTSRMVTANIDAVQSYYGMFNTQDVSVNSTYGVYWQASQSNDYGIYKAAGAWTQPLHINFYTGIRLRSHQSYGGTQFYNVSSGNTVMGVNNGDNNVHVYTALYSPIMYDENNTGYYLDPASTSNLVGLTVANTISGNISGNANSANYASYLPTAYVGGQQLNPQTYFNNGIGVKVAMTAAAGIWSDTLWINGYSGDDVLQMCALHTQRNGTPRIYISNQASTATSYGTLYEILSNYGGTGTYSTTGDFRAPIFYDSNDTGYYMDPASTSNVNQVVTGVLRFRGEGGDSGNGSVATSYGIYQQGGSWTHPYPDLCIGFHTGIKIGAYYGYNGTRFYNNSDWATITASVNDGDNNFRGYYDIIAYASDKRLKHKVEPIENALEKVKSLTGMTYQWNEIGKEHGWDPDTTVREAGVFAQDVQSVLPEAVKLAPFDDDKGISKSGENFLTVKYDKIVPLLIEAIKEQQTQIEELKELVKQLINK